MGKYFHVISLVLFQLSFAVLQVESVHSSHAERVLISFFVSLPFCPDLSPHCSFSSHFHPSSLHWPVPNFVLFSMDLLFKIVISDSFPSKCIQKDIFSPHISSGPLQVSFVSEVLDRYFTSMTDISGFISLHQKYS